MRRRKLLNFSKRLHLTILDMNFLAKEIHQSTLEIIRKNIDIIVVIGLSIVRDGDIRTRKSTTRSTTSIDIITKGIER